MLSKHCNTPSRIDQAWFYDHFSPTVTLPISLCFVVGLVVRTGPGLRAKNAFEQAVLEKLPGYTFLAQTQHSCHEGPNRAGTGGRLQLNCSLQ